MDNTFGISQFSTVIGNKDHYYIVYVFFAEGKMLKDDQTLGSLNLGKKGQLFFKDLGPQVGWTTVRF